MYLNKVIIIGEVCNQPELRMTKTNIPVTNFTVKTMNTWIEKSTQKQIINTEYHKIVCWNELAKTTTNIIKKGQSVLVEGELSYYTKNNNQQTEIKAFDVQINVNVDIIDGEMI